MLQIFPVQESIMKDSFTGMVYICWLDIINEAKIIENDRSSSL